MPALIRSKLVLSLAAIVMIASAVVIPLSEKITQVHAAPRTAHTTLAAGDSPQLIGSLDTSGSGGSAGTNLDPAVALTFCIGYGTPNISFTPLPSHPMQATIGCDKEFFPGQSTSVDYNASNSLDFGAFVNFMTNGTSDTIWTCREAVDSNSVATPPAGCVGYQEDDRAGYAIDFVRLIVNQVQ